MATNTHVALDKATVSGSSTTTVTFTVPSGYTDLFIVTSARNSTSGGTDYFMRFNSDTASNYSYTQMIGNGSSAASDRAGSASQFNIGYVAGTSGTAPTICRINIQNYSNTNTYKTILYNWNSQGADAKYVLQGVGVWRKTPEAITSVSIYTTSGNMVEGSTFSLYGIAALTVPGTAKATGGTITYDAFGYVYHTFTSSGTFTPSVALSCDALVVAGGGAGAGVNGGWGAAGGAGGLLGFTAQSLSTAQTITVGGGGAGAAQGLQPANGSNSQLGLLTAAVGGGGAGLNGSSNGSTGGSGGGANGTGTGGSGTSGQGNAGGSGDGGTNQVAGGGGGATAAGNGGSGSNAYGGAGSSAYSSWGATTSTGENVSGTYWYAGGGGGALANGSQPLGGNGGGGDGSQYNSGATQNNGTAGTANTGGGGGGNVATTAVNGKSGGSGIVIIRYQG